MDIQTKFIHDWGTKKNVNLFWKIQMTTQIYFSICIFVIEVDYYMLIDKLM
jgi:hypothetical protein